MTSFPVTPDGHEKLKHELHKLKTVERPKISKEIGAARELGDLSENFEYHAAKDRQGQIHGKIKYLKSQIARARVIDPSKLSGDRVVFGAIVTVFDLDTEVETTYQIVGEEEADYKEGRISVTSPLARALLGKEEGDETKVKAPNNVRTLEISEVRFPEA